MSALSRTDNSVVGRWWWTVDKLTLVALIALAGVGMMLTMAASPSVAARLGLDPQYFVMRHAMVLPLALVVMVTISTMTLRTVRVVALFVFLVSLGMLVLTLMIGSEVKGASRWIHLGSLSIQPSEFIKPSFAVLTAWLIAARFSAQEVPGAAISTVLFALVAALLISQPDIGQTGIVAAVWLSQWFLAGLSIMWLGVSGIIGAAAMMGAYFTFPHVTARIDRFIDPNAGGYQIERAMQAFMAGGYFGEGPGEGIIKASIPDAHTDMVMAVAAEEFGLIATLAVVAIFAFIVLRGFSRLFQNHNMFVTLAGFGLLVQFGLQALVNMGSTLNLIPTKGMTLPFLSYGGSSLLAMAFGMGMLLALTRRRIGEDE